MTKSALCFYRALSAVAIASGCAGMAVSFLFLASTSFEDITAGTSGFMAGAILIGSGLISAAMLAGTVDGGGDAQAEQVG